MQASRVFTTDVLLLGQNLDWTLVHEIETLDKITKLFHLEWMPSKIYTVISVILASHNSGCMGLTCRKFQAFYPQDCRLLERGTKNNKENLKAITSIKARDTKCQLFAVNLKKRENCRAIPTRKITLIRQVFYIRKTHMYVRIQKG